MLESLAHVAGLLLAAHFVLLSAEANVTAVHAQLSGLQGHSCRLMTVPALSSCTCGRWVNCGPCVVSWPQPAAAGRGSGSHPTQCVAPGLLWWGSSFPGRWLLSCCLPSAPSLVSLSTFSDPGRPQWAVTCCRNAHLWQIAQCYLVFVRLGQRFLCSFCRCPTPPPRPLFCHRTATHRRHSAHLIPVSSGSVLTPLRPLLTPRLMSTKVSWFVSVCVRVCMCVYMYVCGCEMWVSQHMNAYMCVFNIG